LECARVLAAARRSGIDFALALAAILESEEVAREIQPAIEYDPAPPLNSGSPKTAAREMVDRVRARGAQLSQARKTVAARVGKKLGV
jgi:cyclohexyl-isocyanide hydratase